MKPMCARRSLRIGGAEVAQTPLVLPSFSSKVFGAGRNRANLSQTVSRIGDLIVGPILVSAYDLRLGLLNNSLGKPALSAPLTFIDSGGYEVNQIAQEAAEGQSTHDSAARVEWGSDDHDRTLASWPADLPAVVVNFDTYSSELGAQVEAATLLCPGRSVGRMVLLKPGQENGDLLGVIRQIGIHATQLAGVDAVGLTEKEAGTCLRDRLRTIAALRGELNGCGLGDLPIHVFGGLDPVRAPLYFLAGADIFDGLSWLRYGFERGEAVYLDAYASFAHPDVTIDEAMWLVRRANYFETTRMQTGMLRFLATREPNRLHGRAEEMLSLLADI